MNPELQAADVHFAYQAGRAALDGVTVRLRPGQLAGIVGPNGSGKSTLLRVLAGILRPASGEIRLGERRLRDFSRLELARRLAFLPQSVAATFSMKVRDVVAQGRFPHTGLFGFLSHRDDAVIDRCLARTETTDLAERSFDELSGGERQRVLIASVIAQEPQIMLLDEPTAALDIHHQGEVFNLLSSLAADGLSVAVVTHDLNLASQFCDHLILIQKGRVACEGRPEDVLRQDVLQQIYPAEVLVTTNPVNNAPMVVVVRRGRKGGVP